MNIFLHNKFKVSDSDLRSLKNVNTFYKLSLVLSFIYILKTNFQFGIHSYNVYYVPFFILFAATPLLFRYFQNLKLNLFISLIIGSCLLSILMGSAGGLASTGLIWLSVIPLVGGTILKKEGIYTGLFIIVLTLLAFVVLGLTNSHSTELIQKIHATNVYFFERATDLISFTVFNAFIAYYFISSEEKLNLEIIKQRDDTESLLKVILHDVAGQVTSIGLSQKKLRRIYNENTGVGSEEIDKTLSRLERGSNDLIRLLDVVRKMSSLKDGKVDLAIQLVCLNSLIKDSVSMLSSRLEQKNIKLKFNNVEEQIHAKVDATIFKNVIIANIISNAIKFSEENASIDIRVLKSNGNIRVEVQDYGIGIPPDIVSNLFSFKSKTTRVGTSGESGTGYGMPLVKEFMDKMGGRIFVESSEIKTDSSDRGTIMILEFPEVL